MSFLETYDRVTREAPSHEEAAKAQLALLQEWVVERPEEMFGELRRKRPIFDTPGPMIVTRYRDVIEVIDLDEIFTVKPYGVAMIRNNGGGNFILGMENTPEFETDLSILRLAVRRDDLERVRTIVSGAVKEVIDQHRDDGGMDITDGYARLIPILFCQRYFGIPGPDTPTLRRWVRAIFTDLFLNFTQDQKISEAGMAAGVEFRAHVDAMVAQRKKDRAAGAAPVDDVLGRLVDMQGAESSALTDSRLRDNLIGCITGVPENTNTAIVNIMNYLFDHPDVMEGAVAAAKANDDALMLKYVNEILRFHTAAPLVVRLSAAEHTVGKGTEGATTVPPGKVVFASTGSAMMDESVVDQPHEFRLGRPSHHYLHFGWGLHQCLGKYISQVQAPEMIKGLLQLEGIRRAEGEAGKLQYHGPFPKSFGIQFGAVRRASG